MTAPVPAGSEAMRHYEAVADTGDAYTQFHGWVLTCRWCDHEARAVTKTGAVAAMQEHYDSVCGRGRVLVSERRSDR